MCNIGKRRSSNGMIRVAILHERRGMVQTVEKILKSEIMYYVIVPFVIVFLGWIKNGYDLKVKNKELGYWMKKYKK